MIKGINILCNVPNEGYCKTTRARFRTLVAALADHANALEGVCDERLHDDTMYLLAQGVYRAQSRFIELGRYYVKWLRTHPAEKKRNLADKIQDYLLPY